MRQVETPATVSVTFAHWFLLAALLIRLPASDARPRNIRHQSSPHEPAAGRWARWCNIASRFPPPGLFCERCLNQTLPGIASSSLIQCRWWFSMRQQELGHGSSDENSWSSTADASTVRQRKRAAAGPTRVSGWWQAGHGFSRSYESFGAWWKLV